jgi:hypothetical protein
MSRDDNANNIFHLAAKDGNIDMVTIFFKVITPRNCLVLLAGRNHVSPLLFSSRERRRRRRQCWDTGI